MNRSGFDLNKILWIDPSVLNSYKNEEQYREHILEQYKMYVEMADRISSRRDTANAFFLAINGLILSSAAALIEKGYELNPKWALLFPISVLLFQCFFWWRLILSYKQLNGVKFQIVGEFERKLPASPYGSAEWENMLERGENRRVYWPLTHLESKVPGLFAVAYVVAALALFFST